MDSATGISKRSLKYVATFGSWWPSSIFNLKVETISFATIPFPSAHLALGSILNQYVSESSDIFQCS